MMKRAISFMISVVIAAGLGAVYANASDSITAAQGVAQMVTGPDAVCKNITNNSATGLSEYVPTQTAAEWQSFVASPPAGVALAQCSGYWVKTCDVMQGCFNSNSGVPYCGGNSYCPSHTQYSGVVCTPLASTCQCSTGGSRWYGITYVCQ